MTIYEKVKISIFSRTFLKTITFVFLGLTFIIREVQNEDSLSRQFCIPVLGPLVKNCLMSFKL